MGSFAQKVGWAGRVLLSDLETMAVPAAAAAAAADTAEAVVGRLAYPGTTAPDSAGVAAVAVVAQMGCTIGRSSVVAEMAAAADTVLVGCSSAVAAFLPAVGIRSADPVIRMDCKSSPADSLAAAARHN